MCLESTIYIFPYSLATPAASLDGVGPEVPDTTVEPRQMLTDILARGVSEIMHRSG